MLPIKDNRAIAAKILAYWQQKRCNAHEAFRFGEKFHATHYPQVKALVFSAMRHYNMLQSIVEMLLKKPFGGKDSDVYALLLIGMTDCEHLGTSVHTSVHLAVEATCALGKPWAKGLVNAILRRFLRERDALRAKLSPAARVSHPEWLFETIQQDWPDEAYTILLANNAHPPFYLRSITDRDTLIQILQEKGVDAVPLPNLPNAIRIPHDTKLSTITPLFHQHCMVQDIGAQCAAPLLGVQDGMRVLDACASPGGKSAHLLSLAKIQLTALEIDPTRLPLLENTLSHHDVRIQCADASDTQAWWDGQHFDRILLDAPCSGSGVLRRHPEGKWLKQPTDIPPLQQQQTHLINALWPLLKPGGIFLYVTCSLFKAENETLMDTWLKVHPQALPEPISLPLGQQRPVGWQILPGESDGFFFAKWRKPH